MPGFATCFLTASSTSRSTVDMRALGFMYRAPTMAGVRRSRTSFVATSSSSRSPRPGTRSSTVMSDVAGSRSKASTSAGLAATRTANQSRTRGSSEGSDSAAAFAALVVWLYRWMLRRVAATQTA